MDEDKLRKDITGLIDNIKEHSDRLTGAQHLPELELSAILAKISKLYENTVVLKHSIRDRGNTLRKGDFKSVTENPPNIKAPGMAHADMLNRINEKIKTQEAIEIPEAAKMDETVKMEEKKADGIDLKKMIGLNERYLFSAELFNKNMEAFNTAIEELNCFQDIEMAKKYIDNVLADENNWDMENEHVVQFITIIERRFRL